MYIQQANDGGIFLDTRKLPGSHFHLFDNGHNRSIGNVVVRILDYADYGQIFQVINIRETLSPKGKEKSF